MDKRSGGVCLSISAKGLSITGIDDRRYWTHIPTDESRLVFFTLSCSCYDEPFLFYLFIY